MDKGLRYKRIHKVLVKEGFEVGKSPNCVNSMIKKRLKREEFLNQKDDVEYKDGNHPDQNGIWEDPDVQLCNHYGIDYDYVNCIELA